ENMVPVPDSVGRLYARTGSTGRIGQQSTDKEATWVKSQMSKKHKPHCYEYPHPSVTVDCLIFALGGNDLRILLVRRKGQPYRGCWALPGGFVEIDEGVDAAALRELQEETGVEDLFLEQLHTFGEPKRDPRERVISVAYYSLIRQKEHKLQAGSDASDTQWFPVRRLPKLAFDHDVIIAMALERLQCRVRSAPVIFELLSHKFRMDELQ